MSHRTRELAERHAALLLRAAAQRRAIARELGAIEERVQTVDQFLIASRDVLRHPAVIGVGLLALLLLGRTRALRLLAHAVLLAGGVRGLLRSASRTL